MGSTGVSLLSSSRNLLTARVSFLLLHSASSFSFVWPNEKEKNFGAVSIDRRSSPQDTFSNSFSCCGIRFRRIFLCHNIRKRRRMYRGQESSVFKDLSKS